MDHYDAKNISFILIRSEVMKKRVENVSREKDMMIHQDHEKADYLVMGSFKS